MYKASGPPVELEHAEVVVDEVVGLVSTDYHHVKQVPPVHHVIIAD